MAAVADGSGSAGEATSGATGGSGSDGSDDAGQAAGEGGCSCRSVGGVEDSAAWLMLLGLAGFVRRRTL